MPSKWRLVLLLLLATVGNGADLFLFPDEPAPTVPAPSNAATSTITDTSTDTNTNSNTNTKTNTDSSTNTDIKTNTNTDANTNTDTGPQTPASSPNRTEVTGDEDYGDYDSAVDPATDGTIEERFFIRKDVSASIGRKLGDAASSFMNMLNPSRAETPPSQTASRASYVPTSTHEAPPDYSDRSEYSAVPRRYRPSTEYGGYHPALDVDADSRYPDYPDGSRYPADPDYRDTGGYPAYTSDPIYGRKPAAREPLASATAHPYGAPHATATVYGPRPGYPADSGLDSPAYHDGENSVADYPEYEPPVAVRSPQGAHGFPVDAQGRILCGKVPRWRKKACRRARRLQRKKDNLGVRPPPRTRPPPIRPPTAPPTAPPPPCPAVPDKQAMQEAQETCCSLQQKDDIYGFNNCCQTLGFCPICSVDSEKLAKESCCPLEHGGDTLGFRQCCSRFGTCPDCGPAPTPEPKAPEGCVYKGKLFPVGKTLDILASKCMFVYCKDNGEGPEVVLDYIQDVDCCEKNGQLYPPDGIVQNDECTNFVCEDGDWVLKPSNMAALLTRPCPEGWIDIGGSCIFIWRELMTFKNANDACKKLNSQLALPQNRAQLAQLINEFRNMEGRDSSRELGGWVNARFKDRQWQTLEGDTLTFSAWEEGHPDDLRRTNCAGLTVTQRSQGWKDYMCHNKAHMLYPICQVKKPACGEERSGCGPYEGDMMFSPNNTEITLFSSACEKFVCTPDSYVVRVVHPLCCYHHEWSASRFGSGEGWTTGLFPPGPFQMLEGMRCKCESGRASCTSHFDG